ncbi:MAG: hypothetical protein KAJ55_10350, partial [Anaerolineales bacterium]|nr:hypothetical protein [Anaerolineales bacterium]
CQGSTWRPFSLILLSQQPFASLPSALFVGSYHKPGARWCSLQVGAAISLPVSPKSPDVSRSRPNKALAE